MKSFSLVMLTLFSFLSLVAQNNQVVSGASAFQNGFAHIENDDKSFYIDSLGQYAFDYLINGGKENNFEWENTPEKEDSSRLPNSFFIAFKNGKQGVLSNNGRWILKPIYQNIDTKFVPWKVTLHNKVSYYSSQGFILPFIFENIGYLNGVYFDVQQNGKWGVYDAVQKKMVIPALYQQFDYCGGCGNKADYVYAKKNDQWGVLSFLNKELIPFKYESEHYGMRSDEWVQAFSKNKNAVILNLNTGKEYAEPMFTEMHILANGLLVLKKGNKYGAINTMGAEVLPFIYSKIEDPNHNNFRGYFGPYALINLNGKMGVANEQGKIIVPPTYYDIKIYDNFFVVNADGKEGLIDVNKNWLLPAEYSKVSHINNYFYSSGSGGKNIFITKQKALLGLYFVENNKIIKPSFQQINEKKPTDNFTKYVIEVIYQDQKGLYDSAGNNLLPLAFDNWKPFTNALNKNLLKVEKQDKWGLFDVDQKQIIIPINYNEFGIKFLGEDNHFITAQLEPYGHTQTAVFTLQGKEVFPLQSGSWRALSKTYSLFKGESFSKNYLLNHQTKKITELPFQQVWDTKAPDRLLVAKEINQPVQLYDLDTKKTLKEKYNPINFSVKNLPQLKTYPVIWPFSFGLARIEKNNNLGFINREEKIIIPFAYDITSVELSHGITLLANLKKNDVASNSAQEKEIVYGFADSVGKMFIPLAYDFDPNAEESYIIDSRYVKLCKRVLEDYFYVYKMGVAHKDKGVLLPPIYDRVFVLNSGLGFLLYNKNKFGLADKNGKVIVPVELDEIAANHFTRYHIFIDLSFPLLAKKNNQWQYFTLQGNTLNYTAAQKIDFVTVPGK